MSIERPERFIGCRQGGGGEGYGLLETLDYKLIIGKLKERDKSTEKSWKKCVLPHCWLPANKFWPLKRQIKVLVWDVAIPFKFSTYIFLYDLVGTKKISNFFIVMNGK